jgi:uncharacterized protein (TIGR02001 family)
MKYSKYLTSGICVLLGLFGFQVEANDGITANVGFTNNYLWRGVTQSDKKPAVSGGLDYSHNSGFYVGTWASNIDFGDNATIETDFYAGFTHQIGDISYDFGYIYYGYPDGDDLNFSEIMASASWKFLSVGISTTAQSDWESDFGDDTYFELNVSFEVFQGVEFGLHLGSYDFNNGTDYIDYNMSLSKNGLSFMISAVDEDEIDDEYSISISYTHEVNF